MWEFHRKASFHAADFTGTEAGYQEAESERESELGRDRFLAASLRHRGPAADDFVQFKHGSDTDCPAAIIGKACSRERLFQWP